MFLSDIPKVDCHCHLFDPAAFPYNPEVSYHPTGHEIATHAQMGHVFATHNVKRALLVQPSSGYGDDNSCMLSAITNSGGAYRGIAVVAADISEKALADLQSKGIVGVALNLPFHPRGHYENCAPLLAKLQALDMYAQVQVEDDMLLDVLPMLLASGVKLLFDHCGRPAPAKGLDQPAFEALLTLGRDGRAAVKLSGYMKFSTQSYPFHDTAPYAQALLQAFGPQACVWGSDWPFLRATERVDYAPLVDLFATRFTDPAVQRAILWDTPNRLFGFDRGS
ncbi:hypothetical protein BFP70_19050 [Thioclava sp. SK-1]|uniref:amidohydrolase family protein n=1 Tax=Thioclava sp. SK-1 TaxID=1889770 RepID=UPI0008259E9D|nr:amidohydrolase family protein [Thioclava sp. SK-1]OCX58158.1 hypothetical protein BFP70_19050 [Thioclava sp. SK-1]